MSTNGNPCHRSFYYTHRLYHRQISLSTLLNHKVEYYHRLISKNVNFDHITIEVNRRQKLEIAK